jgi:uncharacterized membrane protein YjgN (DUF898 family)
MILLDKNQNNSSSDSRQLVFKGDGGSLFGIMIVNTILTILTLGIYHAWGKVKERKYIYNATELEGSGFEYHATGKELFMGYLKALALILVIYAFIFGITFLGKGNITITVIGMLVVYALFFALFPVIIHGSLRFNTAKTSWRGIHWGYRGRLKELFTKFIKGIALSIVTLGIYGAWMDVDLRKYILTNLRFGNITFDYQGKGNELFVIMLKGFFLTIITFGIYIFWFSAEVFRYHTNQTLAIQDGRQIDMKSNMSGGDVFGQSFVNILLIVFTLGIAIPWVICRQIRFYLSHVDIVGDFRGHEVKQTESDADSASADSMSDILDIGL